jgi:hypothetical protein
MAGLVQSVSSVESSSPSTRPIGSNPHKNSKHSWSAEQIPAIPARLGLRSLRACASNVALSLRHCCDLTNGEKTVHRAIEEENKRKLVRSVVAITLALLICLPGCTGYSNRPLTGPPNIPPRQPNVASLDPQDWYIFYSAGVPVHPSPNVAGAWSFQFPTTGHVNYIQTPFNATATLQRVRITFRVDSDAPQYEVMDPADILPATVHVFFEQRDDNLINPDGRWWADTSGYNLGSHDGETITVTVPLDPGHWSNVYDDPINPQSFYVALKNVGWIGVTCGGQYFWGHGVALGRGTASYTLIDFRVD